MMARYGKIMRLMGLVLLAQVAFVTSSEAGLKTPKQGWNQNLSCVENLVVGFGTDAEAAIEFCSAKFPLLKTCVEQQQPIKDCMDVSPFSIAQMNSLKER